MDDDYLTIRPHIMKLCILTDKIYWKDARHTKTSHNSSAYRNTYVPSYL